MMEGINKQPPNPSNFDSKHHQVDGAEDVDLDAILSQIESGNFKTALQVLSKESVVSLKLGPQQDSLLHYASKQGNMTVVKRLVQEYSCSPLACNQRGQTCLHAATSCGQLDVLRYLLQVCTTEDIARASCRGEKKEGKWREEETGSMGGEGEKIVSGVCDSDTQVGTKDNHLVDSTASTQSSIVCSSVDKSGNSLLHICAMHGELRIAKFLVSETEATVLTTNVDGHNPVHLAAKHGHLDILKYLATVSNCSPPRDKEGRSALHLAVEGGHVDVARFLLDHKLCDPTDTITKCGHYAANSSLLHIAAQNGHLEIMIYLVDEVSCNLYQKDGSNNLPLHVAVIHGTLEIVKYLVYQKWHSPFCRGEGGKTVLHLASQHGHLEILQYFIEQVKIILSHEDFTTLLSAAQTRSLVHLKKLLEKHMYGEIISKRRCDRRYPGFATKRLEMFGPEPSALESLQSTNFDYQSPACIIETACNNFAAMKVKQEQQYRDSRGQTPLHSSCIEGHEHITQYLIEECNIYHSCTDDYNIIPLHVAAKNGHVHIVRFLVEKKCANLLSRDCYSNTPLHYAAEEGRLEAVQYIVDRLEMLQIYCQGTFLHSVNNIGMTPLHSAVLGNQLTVVKYLVEERHCDPLFSDSIVKLSAFHFAAAFGQVNIIHYFFSERKCDPMLRSVFGRMPIHIASINGHIKAVQYLVENCNVDILCRDDNKYNSLHLAAYRGHTDVLKYLAEKNHDALKKAWTNNNTVLHIAAANGHVSVVRFLIEQIEFDPVCENLNKQTPIHLACVKGQLQVVKYLHEEHEVSLCYTDINKFSLLHTAAHCGHLPIVDYLVNKQCDILQRNSNQNMPLHCAAMNGHLEIVKVLLAHMEDHMHKGQEGWTAFHLAVIQGHSEIVEYFIGNNMCDPMMRGVLDRTPVHLASLKGHLSLIKLFVEEYNVDYHCYDQQKQTPLHLAAQGGQLDVFMYLIGKGCDPNCCDGQNVTPLHVAAYCGHLNVVKYAINTCHCDVQRRDSNNNSALHFAAWEGQLCVVRHFILNTACEAPCKGYRGRIPLHSACERGHLNVVKYYVDDLHVSPSYADDDGNTPLHLAVMTEQMDIMKYLVEDKQCNILITNKYQKTPLHEALFKQKWKTIQYLTDEKRFNLKETPSIMQHLITTAIMNDDLSFVDRCCTLWPADISVYQTPLQLTNIEFTWRPGTANTISSHLISGSPFQFGRHVGIWCQLPVHMACVCDNLPILKCLVQHGMDPDLVDNNYTPLHIAALRGHLPIVKYLVENAKCKLDSTDKLLYTPLHLAVTGKRLDVVKYLILKKACDPMQRTHDGLTCLHIACSVGDINTVTFLITDCNVTSECTDNYGETPLHIAALHGHLNVVKYLVETHKCDPTKKSNNGSLALHFTSLGGSLDVFKYLIKSSDPLATDNLGRSSIHCAVISGQLKIIKYAIDYLKIKFTQDFQACTPLHFAAIGGNLDIVKILVQHQNDSRHGDFQGRLPLHRASEYGHLELVKYFTDTLKCNPSCCDEHNRTPLHLACLNSHVQVAEYLIMICKVNPDCRDVRKCTPLHCAAVNGNLSLVKTLLDKGCDIASRDEMSLMPIHYACSAGHLHIVQFFIMERNCNPNPEGKITTLHSAVHGGHLHVVRFLTEQCKGHPLLDGLHFSAFWGHLDLVKYYIREQNCSPISLDAADRTPLHFASMAGHLHVVQYLVLENNADISLEDDDGHTPVHLASINGHLNVMTYLLNQYKESVLDLCDELIYLASKHGHLNIIQFMLEKKLVEHCLKMNSKKALDIAHENGHTEIVRYFFSKGYVSDIVQPSHYTHPPILPSAQMYVIGNHEAGKTTLIKSLQSPSSLSGWLSSLVWSVCELYPHRETAGIVPTELQKSKLGNITIFDFAGQTEYYTSHGDFLEGISYAVVLLTIDMNCSEKTVKKAFKYWHMFIQSVTNKRCVVRIVVVGTHRDKLDPKQRKQQICVIQECMQESQSQFLLYVGCIALNCHDSSSQEFSKLTDLIESCYKMVCLNLQLDYRNGSILNVFLKNRFPKATVCSFHNLHKCLERSTAPDLLPLKSCGTLYQACETLHESGYTTLLKLSDTGEMWLILKSKEFLAKLHDLLKHPKFPTTKGLGLLSAARLTCFLNEQLHDSDIPSQLVIHYMVTMQYCVKVDDPEIMKVVSKITSTANEEFYFFPQLVQLQQPEDMWTTSSNIMYKCGWRLKCADDHGFFNPNYCHILLIYMVLKFGLIPKLNSQGSIKTSAGCKLWKNGVRWLDPAGVEVVIEVSGEQNSVVSLLMRCHQRAELQLVALRSFLVKQILKLKEKHSPSCTCEEVLIHPHCLTQFPSEQSSEIKMSDLSMAVVWKRPNVLLDEKRIASFPNYPFLAVNDLVYYDGYVGLGPVVLRDLLMEENQDKVITGHILKEVAKAVPTTSLVLKTVLGMKTSTASDSSAQSPTLLDTLRQWSAETDGKYGTLRNALDQYSLFAGRLSLLSQFLDICEQTDALSIISQRAVEPVPARNEGRPRMNDFRWLEGRDRRVQIIESTAHKWETVAYSFHLEPPEVNTIKRNSFFVVETACETMLSKWLLGEHRKPVTWSTVVECLRECEFQTLADDLEHILCPEECVGSNSDTDKGKHKGHAQSGVDCSQPRLHELKVLKKEHSTIKIIQTVAPKWKELAAVLQLTPDGVEEIVEETSEEEQACEAVFGRWLCGRHRVPVTWSTVVRCLSECGFQELAQDVAKVLDLQ